MNVELRRIYGIDFSGAKDAGNKIWISSGVILDNHLQIDICCQACKFLSSKPDRDDCLCKLREFIGNERNGVFGMDFPFGLPEEVIKRFFEANTWEKFVNSLRQNFSTAKEFNKACKIVLQGEKSKRKTDICTKTPWTPYFWMIRKQTYYGICYILQPLIQHDTVCVLPMQKQCKGKPLLIEICPASTLKSLNQYYHYKGNKPDRKENRDKILSCLEDGGMLSIEDSVGRDKIIENKGGDALDSVVAALETYRALKNEYANKSNCYNPLEGYVYLDKSMLVHELAA
jgi:hypothetical protein